MLAGVSSTLAEWYIKRNETPLKAWGRVAYYFKQTDTGGGKRKKGIYMFFHHEQWRPRNMRVIGLMDAYPFFKRDMTLDELKDCHFDTRERYIVYIDWETLLEDDALFGVTEEDLHKLREYVSKYPLPTRKKEVPKEVQTELFAEPEALNP